MHSFLAACESALGLSILVGSICWAAVAVLACFFRKREFRGSTQFAELPPVTLMKPVYGLEKNLRANLETACKQDYPNYQVLYSVQRADDPAIPLLCALQDEFGAERVTVVVADVEIGVNGKINNLAGALSHARHEIVVMSDSDIQLRADFLRTIVAPLADPAVGAVSTFFKARDAGTWYEHMEQLSINVDQFAMAMLASATKLVNFCFGASIAMSKRSLAAIGGLEALADYLVEDNELGRRVVRSGKKLVTIPYVVETTIDLKSPAHWWQKQTYWDQNSRVAVPGVFIASLALRTIPLSLLFAALRSFDAIGLGMLAFAVGVRMAAVVLVLGVALGERASLRSVWLVPIKDLLSLAWFAQAFVKPTVVWRGVEMALTRDGRLTATAPKNSAPGERAS